MTGDAGRRISGETSILIGTQAVRRGVPPQVRTPPGAVACASVLAMVTLGLRLKGLRFTKSLAEWLIARRRQGLATEHRCVPLVVRRVDLAAAFFPGRARCLERSIALHVCLRWCGLPTMLRLGVQPYPFSAHAWVELDGEPVGDSPDSIALYSPLSLEKI